MCVCLGKRDFGDRTRVVPKPQDACALPWKQMPRNRKPGSRCHQLNLSLTESELADIKRRAEALGMRPVHFGRALLVNGAVTIANDGEAATPALRLIHTQLLRLGNNLNQAVRKLNQLSHPLPADLEPLLHDIRQLIARIPQ